MYMLPQRKLNRHFVSSNSRNIKESQDMMILGGWNVKIEKEDINRDVAGNYSKHTITNITRQKLVNYDIGRQMVMKSTLPRRKLTHKGTSWQKMQ